jgi:hypothetical protein
MQARLQIGKGVAAELNVMPYSVLQAALQLAQELPALHHGL